jgi:hypothetical protein
MGETFLEALEKKTVKPTLKVSKTNYFITVKELPSLISIITDMKKIVISKTLCPFLLSRINHSSLRNQKKYTLRGQKPAALLSFSVKG